ncbi:hypothetical protein A225_2727 [Klebsiella michiganensis E718]|nr:hypothetical protein A225_2727 [Klebsiella michiganensis E718]
MGFPVTGAIIYQYEISRLNLLHFIYKRIFRLAFRRAFLFL